jgi:uncharacterized protein YvpB
VDVFVRGSDGGLWHRSWDGSTWNWWEPLGGALASGPTVTSSAPDRLDVFVSGSDLSIYQLWWDGAWHGWQGIGLQPAGNTIRDVSYFRQVYALSCEEASLQMALTHQAIGVPQWRMLNDIGVDRRRAYRAGGVLRWGDPYASVVGDPNGSEVQLTGYGTYHSTIARVAAGYGAGVEKAGEGISPQEVYRAVLLSHPVVAWISFDWRYHPPGGWLAFDGRWVPYAGPVEHTVTVVGVSGDSVYVFNPLSGPQWVSKATFEAAYRTYNDMAVILN